MGVVDAPAWLLPAFVRSVTAIGATAPRPEIEEEGESLIARWGSPDRRFHGISHLVAVLERVDTLAQETHNPDVVRVAAWYHGAVFDTAVLKAYNRAIGENKQESAALARYHLKLLGVPAPVALRVHDLILDLTRHDADPSDVDARALCDADLASLAVEPQKFKAYRTRVREEFSHLPVRDYVEARIAITTRLLDRRHIFSSPLAAEWEEPARQNLEAELVHLRAELATLPEAGESEPAPAVPAPEPAAREVDLGDVVDNAHERPERYSPDLSYERVRSAISAASPALPHGDAAEDDDAEMIGLPFEERPRTLDGGQGDMTSGIEREPIEPGSLPRRMPVAERLEGRVRRGDRGDRGEGPDGDRGPGGDRGEGPEAGQPAESPSSEAPKRPRRARPSTPRHDDDDATGSLFRPIDF